MIGLFTQPLSKGVLNMTYHLNMRYFHFPSSLTNSMSYFPDCHMAINPFRSDWSLHPTFVKGRSEYDVPLEYAIFPFPILFDKFNVILPRLPHGNQSIQI